MERAELIRTVAELIEDGSNRPAMVRIRGRCMDPSLEDREQVPVTRARRYFPGDIVVFRSATGFVAHRLLGIAFAGGRLGYVTKGDHCARHDGVVEAGRVMGRVARDVRLRERAAALAAFVALVAGRLAGRR